ncbi:hypothetical protein CR513_50398, partial [Mucuna pruriens]
MLASPLLLSKLREDTPIIVYLSISNEAVSTTLEQEARKDPHPIYFVNKVLAYFITEKSSKEWTLSVDGSSNQKGSGVSVVLEGPDGVLIKHKLKINFPLT